MQKTHDFKESFLVGKKGESLIKEWLSAQPGVKTINDLSDDPAWWPKDIDISAEMDSGETVTYEIKTDRYTSGNIFYETVSNVEHNVPGCMVKSEADFLLYYFTETRELYIIKFPEYKAWFDKNKAKFKKKELKNIDKKRKGTYTSVGYTIPKKFLEENFSEFQKEILESS